MIYPAARNQSLIARDAAIEALIQGSQGIRLASVTLFECLYKSRANVAIPLKKHPAKFARVLF